MINKINIDCLDIPNWNHSDELLIECYTVDELSRVLYTFDNFTNLIWGGTGPYRCHMDLLNRILSEHYGDGIPSFKNDYCKKFGYIFMYTPMSSSISWTYAYDAVGDSLLNDDCICRVRGYDFITYVDAALSSKLPGITIETDDKTGNTTIEIKAKFNFEEAMDILRALKACTHSDTINKESFTHKYATALMYALDSCLSDVRFCQLHGIPVREKNT